MASIAESSVGSLPPTRLARLEEILQGRVGPEADSNHVGDNTEGSNFNGSNVIPESANGYRTPISSPRTDAVKVPRLESAKSAPPAEMEAMVNPSPSQEAFNAMTRANSFHAFEGGDTQPLDSQLYRDFKESMARPPSATTPRKEKTLLQISPGGKVEYTYDTNATGRTPRTCEEGDTGYIDLENAWQPGPTSPTAGSVSDFGDSMNDESPEVQLPAQEDVFRRPAMPETPSLAGHKRRRSGEMLTSETSAKKTPGFSQLFGFKAQKVDMMTGTQLFEQTQARSSPVLDGPRSDPALTRPSPNIQNHLTVSSPTVMMSSPIANRAPPATAGEPRERYTSLRESQERKRARLEADYGLKRQDTFDDFEEDEEDPHRRRLVNQALRRTLSEDAMHELGRVRAHSKPRSRPATSSSPHKTATIDLRTPATTKKGVGFEFDVSDDGEEPDDRPSVEDEPIVEHEPGDEPEDDDQQSENDVYDEFGGTVLRSQGPGPEDEEAESVRGEEHEDDAHLEMVDETEQDLRQHTLVQGSSQQDRSNLQRRSQTATQHSAIADSQPFRNDRQQTSASQQDTGSPSCSYVPGSQFAGRTSQDQASLPARRIQGSMGPPALSASKSQDANQQIVPSSPPPAGTNGTSVDYNAEYTHEQRKRCVQSQPNQEGMEQQAEPEIPESDLPATDLGSSRPATAEDLPHTESNNAPFSTARLHLPANGPSLSQGAPPPSPLKAFASQQSRVSSQSPRTKAGVRRFADIAGVTTAPTGSGETLADVDAVMSDFMNAEDQNFLAATSSPPRERPQKRRRTIGKPSIRSSSPVKEAQADVREAPATALGRVELQRPEHKDETELQDDHDDLTNRALRDSPSKANELRAISPPPESTPESVKAREQAGAKAASQLVSKRSTRVAKPTKLSGRKAGARLQHEETVSDKITPKTKAKSKRASNVETAQPPEQQGDGTVAPVDDADEPEIEETIVQTHEDAGPMDQEQQPGEGHVVAPHRVFALFKGTWNTFHPATWLGASSGGAQRVEFDDGTTTSLEPHLIARLEFALGDQVKVDFKGMKNKVWIIKGFGAALLSDKASEALTDTYGHETIKVQAKSTRNSVSGPNAVLQGEGDVVNVAIEVVYLTHSMWKDFSSREFQPGAGQGAAARLETPSAGIRTPMDTETSASRSRRVTIPTAKAMEKRGSFLRDESATAVRTPSAGLFYGMAFAVSFGQNENEKINLTRLIQRNGGTILDEGFERLFDAPNLDEMETHSPAKKSPEKTAKGSHEQSGLQLKAEYRDLGFVALIADKHSRRAKYIQALALGIPTLSGRWIMDSLDASKNGSLSGSSASPLSWTKYLLAAGDSSYLNGAIRSRELAAYSSASAKLDDTVTNRPLLLNGEGVLIVASKKGKGVWERRKAFAFLTLALGAGHVKRVSDLQGAKTLAADEPAKWKFIYVDGSVADASTAVFGKVAAGAGADGGKKRKRDEKPAAPTVPAAKVDAKALSASDGKVRIVNDEFVVQSLILGGLVD